jgi:IMP dehydrogenase
MPLVRDVMTRRRVCLSPEDTVRAAMDLLRAEQLDVLPVTRDGILVGSIRALDLFRLYGEMPLSEAMTEPLPVIDPEAPVGAAAAKMAESRAPALVVARSGEIVGLLTERELADSWGSVPDPLTGLHWQDQMRRWAAAHLRRGREIAVLFLDLNGFGALNKARGHVLGDRVLQCVALALRDCVEPEQDHLCRYGGDEFVVATTRPLLQARALALSLRRAVAALEIAREPEALSISVGIAGGQRSGQRPGTHPSATLDDLINLASRASTHAKNTAEQCYAIHSGVEGADGLRSARGPGWLSEARTLIEGYQVTQRGGEVAVAVSLRRGERSEEGTACRPADEVQQATAEATVIALAAFLPGDVGLDVLHIMPCGTGAEGDVVGATVRLRRPDGVEERLFGAALALPDPSRSVINSVMAATNRRLGLWLSSGRAETAPRLVAVREDDASGGGDG